MTTETIDVDDAQNRLADLIAVTLKGGEVIITRDGKPLARLVPVAGGEKKRVAGLNRGSISMSEDFDESLPGEFWAAE